MHPKRIFLVAAVLVCTDFSLRGQFTDASALLGALPSVATTFNGNGVSFCDFNGDGYDDLSIGRGNQAVKFYENLGGTFQEASFEIPNEGGHQVNAVLWADYNGDGNLDLLLTKENGPIELWRNNGNFEFENVSAAAGITSEHRHYVGAAFADYDHDGDLDFYVATFYSPFLTTNPTFASLFYRNNGDGTFTEVAQEIGAYVAPRTIFQPVFIDYNNDGWEDLYLITDRVFSENALFRNNGNGTFTNVSVESGADLMICSMTGTVGDYDNDSDLDIFITNSPIGGAKLLRNNGDETFSEVSEETGTNVTELGWGGLWLDYDNDSWQDLFISLTTHTPANFTGNRFYRNNQGQNFTDISAQAGVNTEVIQSYVCAMADFNHDGYNDFFINNRVGYTPRLYRNNGGANNYISLNLEGVFSNVQGIGTWIHCYANGHEYVRYKLCGENLIGQNGDRIIFGLGSSEQVDSLVIHWNRGTQDAYYNLPVNTHLHAQEGASAYYQLSILPSGSNLPLCPGESTVLSVGDFQQYLWSNGATTPSIEVAEAGVYWVNVQTFLGGWVQSEPLIVETHEALSYAIEVQHQGCSGVADAAISLSFDGAEPVWIDWSTGQHDATISNLLPGVYSFDLIDLHGCISQGEVELFAAADVLVLPSLTQPLCADGFGSAALSIVGGNAPWQVDWFAQDPDNLPDGSYSFQAIDAIGCSVNGTVAIAAPPMLLLELTLNSIIDSEPAVCYLNVAGGTPPYTTVWSTGLMNSYEIAIANPGAYMVTVVDANGCTEVVNFEVVAAVSVNENTSSQCLIYPNPVTDRLAWTSCKFKRSLEPIQVRISSMSGAVCLDAEVYPEFQYLSVETLSKGVYVVEISQGKLLHRSVFVKQ